MSLSEITAQADYESQMNKAFAEMEQREPIRRKKMEKQIDVSGEVSATIPQRQYENIRVTYKFTNKVERLVAFQDIINDCITYHHIVSKKAKELNDVDSPKGPNSGKEFYDDKLEKWVPNPDGGI